uniref:Uncharacterized protein TCIL3000_11_16480 n=1 Tax=Trypanosoma congolense (strain IL3000) TaxID=1068625 RepID=G0V3B3_TRYCI|nr:unnamed protein product [Trypanosoma congolense IL3000]
MYNRLDQARVSCCSHQFILLALLAVQNATVVILMSYTQQRQVDSDHSPPFVISHVVLMQEVLKVVASLIWCVAHIVSTLNSDESQDHKDSTTHEETRRVTSAGGVRRVGSRLLEGEEDWKEDGETGDAVSLVVISQPLPPRSNRAEFFERLKAELLHRSAVWTFFPAVIYAAQNYILFIALANMEPTLFQITYQTKILGTALFMRLFLNRTFSGQQWMALVLLMVSVILAQIGGSHDDPYPGRSADDGVGVSGNYVVGLSAVALAVVCSSAAAVMVEWIFKSRQASLNSHISSKNVHLSVFSVLFYGSAQLLSNQVSNVRQQSHADAAEVGDDVVPATTDGYFRGFDGLVWLMVVVQALGGLLVALVVKYTDNIMKTFATACAIILSGLFSVLTYSFVPSPIFVIGNILCIWAIIMYSRG